MWLHLANVAAEVIYDLIRRFWYVFRIAIERGAKAAQVLVTCLESKIVKQTVDPSDLSKSEGMNLRRGHIGRGLLSNGLLVASSAFRQAIQPNCSATMQSVVLCDELGEAAISGLHRRVHYRLDLLRQTRLVLGRDRNGKLLRGCCEWIFRNGTFALDRNLLEEEPGRHQSVSFSLAEHLDRLLESTGDLVETRNVILVVSDAVERYGVRKIGKAVVDALHLRDGHLVILQRVVRNAVIQNVKQEIV